MILTDFNLNIFLKFCFVLLGTEIFLIFLSAIALIFLKNKKRKKRINKEKSE